MHMNEDRKLPIKRDTLKEYVVPQKMINDYIAAEDDHILKGRFLINDDPGSKEYIIPLEILDKMNEGVRLETKSTLFKSAFDMFTQTLRKKKNKIGIGITTHNRTDSFLNTFTKIAEYCPNGCEIAVVDDASEFPISDDMTNLQYRFDVNAGIARAKNKCLELLYNAGCEHFFLFDDDTYPIVADWWKPYVESPEPHLMYIFKDFSSGKSPHDMIELYRDSNIVAYSHVRGCMLYYKRTCLDTVGGMDVSFGKWGHEHGDLSNRIYSAGLTRFRYMDVPNSGNLFYAADEQEHGKFVSTVPGEQRMAMLAATKKIYDAQYNTPAYREFRGRTGVNTESNKQPLFLTTYFTTLADPQRSQNKWEFDSSALVPYLITVRPHGKVVILHDAPNDAANLAGGIVGEDNDIWKRVEVLLNPYFQRWVSEYEYLIRNKDAISWVFITDSTDVELLKMPEPVPGRLYIGSEPVTIGRCQWLLNHHRHPELLAFYRQAANRTLLNAGIVGGYIEDVLPFLRAMIDCYCRMTHESSLKRINGPGMTEMGIFNYVLYTSFANKIVIGPQINTKFKSNERNNIAWFKHK